MFMFLVILMVYVWFSTTVCTENRSGPSQWKPKELGDKWTVRVTTVPTLKDGPGDPE